MMKNFFTVFNEKWVNNKNQEEKDMNTFQSSDIIRKNFTDNTNDLSSCISPISSSPGESEKLFDEILPIHVDELFNLFFTSSKFFHNFHASRGTRNLQETPWIQNNLTGMSSRYVSYETSMHKSLDRIEIQVYETQVILPCSIFGQRYSVDVQARCIGIPYTISFETRTHFYMNYISDVETQLQIFSQIKFKNYVWLIMKDLMEKFCWSGVENYFGNLTEAVTIEINEMKEPNRPETKGRLIQESVVPVATENSISLNGIVGEELYDISNLFHTLQQDKVSEKFSTSIDKKHEISDSFINIEKDIISIINPTMPENHEFSDRSVDEKARKINSTSDESRDKEFPTFKSSLIENSVLSTSSMHEVRDIIFNATSNTFTKMELNLIEAAKSSGSMVDEKNESIPFVFSKPMNENKELFSSPLEKLRRGNWIQDVTRENQDFPVNISESRHDRDTLMESSANENSNILDTPINGADLDDPIEFRMVQKKTISLIESSLIEDSGFLDIPVDEAMHDVLNSIEKPQEENLSTTESSIIENCTASGIVIRSQKDTCLMIIQTFLTASIFLFIINLLFWKFWNIQNEPASIESNTQLDLQVCGIYSQSEEEKIHILQQKTSLHIGLRIWRKLLKLTAILFKQTEDSMAIEAPEQHHEDL